MNRESEKATARASLQRKIVAICVIFAAGWLWMGGESGANKPQAFAPLRIDPNRVPLPVLGALPGIGASRLKAIEAARETKPFVSTEDFDRRVKGIGPAAIAELRPFFRFETTGPE